MDQINPNRSGIRQEIINRIEAEFPGSIVIWIGTGSPSDDYRDNTEQFEALMIKDEDYKRFVLFAAERNKEIAEPNGFSIAVDAINPELTKDYRWDQYNNEKAKRVASRYFTAKHEKLFIAAFTQTAKCTIESRTISDLQDKELKSRIKPGWDENGANGDNDSDALQGTKISTELCIKVAS